MYASSYNGRPFTLKCSRTNYWQGIHYLAWEICSSATHTKRRQEGWLRRLLLYKLAKDVFVKIGGAYTTPTLQISRPPKYVANNAHHANEACVISFMFQA